MWEKRTDGRHVSLIFNFLLALCHPATTYYFFSANSSVEGKTPREDHAKLKIDRKNVIYGCYAHSEELPNFHRRCYWLLHSPRIVLASHHFLPPSGRWLPLSPAILSMSLPLSLNNWRLGPLPRLWRDNILHLKTREDAGLYRNHKWGAGAQPGRF